MKKFLYVCMVVVLIVAMTGCGNGSQLVGKWEDEATSSYYEFKSNGEGELSFFGIVLTFDYEDDGELITVTMTGEEVETLQADGESITDVLSYEITDEGLSIMGTVFTKVE